MTSFLRVHLKDLKGGLQRTKTKYLRKGNLSRAVILMWVYAKIMDTPMFNKKSYNGTSVSKPYGSQFLHTRLELDRTNILVTG